MKWVNATLNVPKTTGTDALGNETVLTYDEIQTKVRLTNWTLEERAGLDPEYTRTVRKAILRQPNAKTAESITIDDVTYQIIERYETSRWSLLHIRSYKQ